MNELVIDNPEISQFLGVLDANPELIYEFACEADLIFTRDRLVSLAYNLYGKAEGQRLQYKILDAFEYYLLLTRES